MRTFGHKKRYIFEWSFEETFGGGTFAYLLDLASNNFMQQHATETAILPDGITMAWLLTHLSLVILAFNRHVASFGVANA